MMIGTNQEKIVLLTDGAKRHLATSPGAKRGSSQLSQEEKGKGRCGQQLLLGSSGKHLLHFVFLMVAIFSGVR
jgi:hypothetical protein